MGIFAHFPLLKGSQELTKTKGTIWKPLIAVSLLSVFSFTSGQYFPYVTVAISGSGAIAAVPLAIFTVSTAVALVSVAYLVKLAVSRADNKKEAGLSGEESGHTASQEPQKLVYTNCTSLDVEESKLNTPTPTPSSVTLGTAIPQEPLTGIAPPPPLATPTSPRRHDGALSASPPPPPPPVNPIDPLAVARERQKSKTGGSNGSGPEGNSSGNGFSVTSEQLARVKLKTFRDNKHMQQNPEGSSATPESGGNNTKQETREEYAARIEKQQKERRKNNQHLDPNQKMLQSALHNIRQTQQYEEDDDEHESGVDDGEWDEPDNQHSASRNYQQSNEKGRESPDSGNVSGDDVTTFPLHSQAKPPVPRKLVNLQASNVKLVNSEVQDPSTSSFKGHAKFFASKGGVPHPS